MCTIWHVIIKIVHNKPVIFIYLYIHNILCTCIISTKIQEKYEEQEHNIVVLMNWYVEF